MRQANTLLALIRSSLPWPFPDIWYHSPHFQLFDASLGEISERAVRLQAELNNLTPRILFNLLLEYQESSIRETSVDLNHLVGRFFETNRLQKVIPSGIKDLGYIDIANRIFDSPEDAAYAAMLISLIRAQDAERLLTDLCARKPALSRHPDILLARAFTCLKRAEDYIRAFYHTELSEVDQVTRSNHSKSAHITYTLKSQAANYQRTRITDLNEEALQLIDQAIQRDPMSGEKHRMRVILKHRFFVYAQLGQEEKTVSSPGPDDLKIIASDAVLQDLQRAGELDPERIGLYPYYKILLLRLLADNDLSGPGIDRSQKSSMSAPDTATLRKAIESLKGLSRSRGGSYEKARLYQLTADYHLCLKEFDRAVACLAQSVTAFSNNRRAWDNLFTIARTPQDFALLQSLLPRYKRHFKDRTAVVYEILVLNALGQSDAVKKRVLEHQAETDEGSRNFLTLLEVYILLQKIARENVKPLVARCHFLLSRVNYTNLSEDNRYRFDYYNALLRYFTDNSTQDIKKVIETYPEEAVAEKVLNKINAQGAKPLFLSLPGSPR